MTRRNPSTMVRRSGWLFVLPLVASLLWFGAPSQAAGGLWEVLSINSPGCGANEYNLQMRTSGISGTATGHTVITSGGLTYTNDETAGFGNSASFGWNFVDSKDYGAVANPGSYPIPAGQPVKAVFTIEQPKGVVMGSWTLVIASCDSTQILYNDLSSKDADGDLLATPTDKCPSLASSRSNGCPLRARSLTVKVKYGPRRVVGTLDAPGFPALDAGRTVKIWKKRPGPDLKVATRTTSSLGKFRARVGKGRYYATTPGLVVPSAGQATALTSPTVRLR